MDTREIHNISIGCENCTYAIIDYTRWQKERIKTVTCNHPRESVNSMTCNHFKARKL